MTTVHGRHEGEVAVYQHLRLPIQPLPAHHHLPLPHARRVSESSLLALGTLDSQSRPWTTLLGGEAGFASQLAENVLGVQGLVDVDADPVMEAIWEGKRDEEVVGQGEGRMVSALAIEPMTRDRVKLAGRLLVAAKKEGGQVQLGLQIEECLGNCPKYITKRRIVPRVPRFGDSVGRVKEGWPLAEEAVRVLEKADMMFVSSTHGVDGMDTNIRGGTPGFVRIEKNDEEGLSLVYPEFSGNNLFSTLGNLQSNPAVGIIIPDFETSSALFVTGQATILYGPAAGAVLTRSKLAVRITASAARFVESHLAFKDTGSEDTQLSPYNPPLRRLVKEAGTPLAGGEAEKKAIVAKLVGREELTGSVNRYKFVLEGEGVKSGEGLWRAGQYVTLDFEEELDNGYAHMNDDDPQSLNEDYKRTFTISNVPGQNTMEITAKLHGPVTKFLSKHQMRAPLSIPVMGFGGQESFSMISSLQTGGEVVFVAGGVGITPLLAQAPGILAEEGEKERSNKEERRLTVLWSLRRDEVGLALDSFQRGEGLAAVTRVFLTGEGKGDEAEKLRGMGARVEERRMSGEDLGEWKGRGVGFFACASGGMLARIQEWLEGEKLAWEEFSY